MVRTESVQEVKPVNQKIANLNEALENLQRLFLNHSKQTE